MVEQDIRQGGKAFVVGFTGQALQQWVPDVDFEYGFGLGQALAARLEHAFETRGQVALP